MPPALSKSRLIAFRQCPKRLWLEVHRPQLREDSAQARAGFEVGHAVGEVAQRLYDPAGRGVVVDREGGLGAAFERSRALLGSGAPVFEAGFAAGGAYAFADVLLPQGRRGWRLVEVKASTTVKDYQRDDAAIQAQVFAAAGVPLAGVALANIDSTWVYPGGEDYRGLFRETDVTEEAQGRADEVKAWIRGAQAVAAAPEEPAVAMGAQCREPFECGFAGYCGSLVPQATYPVAWLPRVQKQALRDFLAQPGVTELAQVPDELLNDLQRRVKRHSIEGSVYLDAAGARAALGKDERPAYFLDFESVNPAVPIWKGTRPYQQVAFQFSVQRLEADGRVVASDFLDLSGADPSRPLAEALIAACGERGAVYAYNASFERSRIRELAERFPGLGRGLEAIVARLVDLEPIARGHYYHPSQQGSWSLKAVLPAIAPDMDYATLEGVQGGTEASAAYLEAIHPSTSAARKAEIERQLLAYCRQDTLALVRVLAHLRGEGG